MIEMLFIAQWKKSHLQPLRLFQPSTPLLPVQPRASREPIVVAVRLKFGFHSTNPTSASRSYPITALTCYNSLNEQSATFHLRHWLHSKPLDRSFLLIFFLRICTPLPFLEFLPCVSLERMQGNSRMHVNTLSGPFPSV